MANIIKRVWNQNKMVLIEDLKGMAFQAEAEGHTFEISGIDDDGNPVTFSGTPSGVFLRPDNTDVALTCSISGGKIYATFPATCYSVPGRFGLTIYITTDGATTAVYAAIGTVALTTSGTIAPTATDDVVDLINAIATAVASIPASYSSLLADIAPNYSSSALYSVGQYAWYDGDLKRCIVPITVAETYTAAHWTSAVLGNDVADLKSAINTLNIPLEKVIVDTQGAEELLFDTVQGFYRLSDGGFASTSLYKCTYFQCEPGDIFLATATWENNARIAMFYNGVPAAGTFVAPYGDTVSSSVVSMDLPIIIPDGVTYAAFNGLASGTFKIKKIQYSNINNKVESLVLNDSSKSTEQAATIPTTGKLYNVNNKSEVTIANGQYFVQSIPAGYDKIVIISAQANDSTNAYPLICYYDSNGDIISKVPGYSDYHYVEEHKIPDGAVTIAVNATATVPLEAVFTKDTFTAINRKKICYKRYGGILYVATRYNDSNDLVTCIWKKGGNNLPDFGRFYLNPNSEPYPSNNFNSMELLYETGSDYHGPMIVRTVNNRNGSNPYSQYWTGGNHRSNNEGVGGIPTARCVEFNIYADGNEVDCGEGYCDQIRATWVNFVKSYSTTNDSATNGGREVIEEKHELIFDGVEWKSNVELIALEDVIFQKYYGFQYGGIASIYPNVRYYNDVNKIEYNAQTEDTESGGDTCSMIVGYGDDHTIILTLDTSFELGKREHYTGTQGALTYTYGKGYFYVIDNQSTGDANYRVNKGEAIAMRGSYRFLPTIKTTVTPYDQT